MEKVYFNIDSISIAANKISALLKPGLPLLLYGEMGVGKTTLTKYLAAELGCSEEVTSPTFTIMQSYLTKKGTLWHADLYRLDEHHIDELGLDELSRQNMMIIEWPERLESNFFLKYIKATLSLCDDGNRKLSVEIVN